VLFKFEVKMVKELSNKFEYVDWMFKVKKCWENLLEEQSQCALTQVKTILKEGRSKGYEGDPEVQAIGKHYIEIEAY